jgi:DNA-binding transcriptional MocR family regulator
LLSNKLSMSENLHPLIPVLAEAIDDRSARGIAGAVGRLISAGEISPGTRLPTVRDLAAALGTSPARVDAAWRALAAKGVIDTQGRRGSFARGAPTGNAAPTRWWGLTGPANQFTLDLSTGAPDPALLPRLDAAFSRSAQRLALTGYQGPSIVPELEQILRARWRPHGEPERVTVVGGALDAIDRLLTVTVRFGDRVLVEEPGYPPVFDLVEAHGAEAVPVCLDQEGASPIALQKALALKPRAFIVQPRAQNPTGIAMTASRARELARVLQPAGEITVLENDHSADLATGRAITLARHLPQRTVRIMSFSKSHGPDLRLAAVAGPGSIIDALAARRALGPGWTSRLIQSLLVLMLRDPMTIAEVRHARLVYAARRKKLVSELDRLGIMTTGTDGINLWVSVVREREAVHALASQGISVAPGTAFFLDPHPPAFIRVTCGAVAEGYAELAVAIAGAARPAVPSRSSAV